MPHKEQHHCRFACQCLAVLTLAASMRAEAQTILPNGFQNDTFIFWCEFTPLMCAFVMGLVLWGKQSIRHRLGKILGVFLLVPLLLLAAAAALNPLAAILLAILLMAIIPWLLALSLGVALVIKSK